MKRLFIILFFWTSSLNLLSQDTVTVLQYNLLYYGINTDWCTSSNNNINDKDGYLRTIINHIEPDIFTVNELSKSPSIHLHLLDQVLNTDGTSSYKKANFLAEAESDIVNMLYYNSEILELHSHVIAQNYIRDIDVYKLYHLTDDLQNGDTTFLICVVAHLKASSGSTNEDKRKVMVQNTMDFLNAYNDDDNYLMMGDFNVYEDSEPAYQEFLFYENTSLQFNDPVSQPGSWHNNYAFSNFHTQSTHLENTGCAASGGVDDRFDFILISNNIKQGTKNVKYMPGSYWAVGQDGNHFNESINSSPTNTSVPPDVLNALYHNSDHLPVTLKLEVGENVGIETLHYNFDISLVNPVQNELQFSLNAEEESAYQIQIIDYTGRTNLTKQLTVSGLQSKFKINVSHLQTGFYIVRVSNDKGWVVSKKIIKI